MQLIGSGNTFVEQSLFYLTTRYTISDRFETGRKIDYKLPWNADEPNNGGSYGLSDEACLSLSVSFDGIISFNDNFCYDSSKQFICQSITQK